VDRKPKSAEVWARFHCAGERRDVEAGGRRGSSVDDRALLVNPVRRRAASGAATTVAVAVVVGGPRDHLARLAPKDADRDRRRARPVDVDGVAGGRTEQRPERLLPPWSTSSANSPRGLLGRHHCDDRLKPRPTTGQFRLPLTTRSRTLSGHAGGSELVLD
jgi:hypothetical protein